MKNWFNKNYKTLIIGAFLVPIITVAVVSISHVTTWYGISNPVSWAVYLSIGIEIAALSALAAISADMGKKVYFPFSVVTLIQFIGNIFFAYSFIDINSKSFKDWVDLVSPLVSFMGVESTDFVGHKRFLALFAGGMLPIISLSFLHMLVKFTEEDKSKETPLVNDDATLKEELLNKIDATDLIGEVSRLRLSEEDIKKLEEVLLNPPPPNEKLKEAAKKYNEEIIKSATLKEEEALNSEEIIDRIDDFKQDVSTLDKTLDVVNNELDEEPSPQNNDEVSEEELVEEEISTTQQEELVKENNFQDMAEEIRRRQELLAEIMEFDQKNGLYDEPFDNPLIKIDESEIEGNTNSIEEDTPIIEDTYNIAQSIGQTQVTPALSDEEINQMFMDEWERKFDLVEDEYIPTEEEIRMNNELSSLEDPFDVEPYVEEAQKFNIDSEYINDTPSIEELNTNDSFWRDHLVDEEEDEDLKKK